MPLEVIDLHAGYQKGVDILQGVTVTARERQLTTVIGANGVGKSTLLKAVMGQLRPNRGCIRWHDRDLTQVASRDLVRLGIGYIDQQHTLFPQMTVTENLEMGTWSFRHNRSRRRQAFDRAFARAPSLADLRHKRAGFLSGGQLRLLQFERALMSDPELLVVDEPTVGLDPKRSAAIYTHLRTLIEAEGRTILMVDQNVIAGTEVADYVYVLELGANKLEGTKAEFDASYREIIANWLI